ncbi:Uncharacterised protein [uncultured archaeon]|nr:Uncharacterised protein [uncultured archaeon]
MKVKLLVLLMALAIVVPPMGVGFYVYDTGHDLPAWFTASVYILIVCIESLIFVFTAKLAIYVSALDDVFKELMRLASDVRAPLEDMGKMLLQFKDLLPIVKEILAEIDKEEARAFLLDLKGQLALRRKELSGDDLADAAKRLSGGK